MPQQARALEPRALLVQGLASAFEVVLELVDAALQRIVLQLLVLRGLLERGNVALVGLDGLGVGVQLL